MTTSKDTILSKKDLVKIIQTYAEKGHIELVLRGRSIEEGPSEIGLLKNLEILKNLKQKKFKECKVVHLKLHYQNKIYLSMI